jgi:hypothetical protein
VLTVSDVADRLNVPGDEMASAQNRISSLEIGASVRFGPSGFHCVYIHPLI